MVDLREVRRQIQSLALIGMVYAAALIGIVMGITLRPFNRPADEDLSMEPRLRGGERFSYNRRDRDLSRLRRRDLVCWRVSPDDGRNLVGRIVALPGDVLEVRDGHLYLRPSGSETMEVLREVEITARTEWEVPPTPVPRGYCVLLVDKRDWVSWGVIRPVDSRTVGLVRIDLILGKVS